MSKPIVRLMKIGQCHNGQRAWQKMCLRPITIVTINDRTCEAIYHVGHEFNIDAKKMRMSKWIRVWAIVGWTP